MGPQKKHKKVTKVPNRVNQKKNYFEHASQGCSLIHVISITYMCVYVNRVFHLSEHANYSGGWFPRTTSPLTTSSSPPPPNYLLFQPKCVFFSMSMFNICETP